MKKNILTYLFIFICSMLSFSLSAQDYTLDMQDSFGDGWNGNSINIEIVGANGASISTTNYTVLATDNGGDFNIEMFTVCDGGTAIVTQGPDGGFNGDISFTIADGTGAIVYNQALGTYPDPAVEGNVLATLATTTAIPLSCNIICPGDMTVNLGPGECGAPIVYDITSEGDCALSLADAPSIIDFTSDFAAGTWAFNNGTGCGTDFQTVPSIGVDIVETVCNPFTNSDLTITIPASGQLDFDWDYASPNDGSFWDPFGVTINGAFTELTAGGFAAMENGTASIPVTAGDVFSFTLQSDVIIFDASFAISNFSFTPLVADIEINGLASGSIFPAGVNTVVGTTTDACGDPISCTFDVIVNAYTGPVLTNLNCNPNLNVTLDTDCRATIGADDILEGGPYSCYDDYIVTVEGGNPITSPGNYTVTVTDPTGLSCWGSINAEDKTAPILTCEDATVGCDEDLTPAPNAGPTSGVLVFPFVNGQANVNIPAGAIVSSLTIPFAYDDGGTFGLSASVTSPNG